MHMISMVFAAYEIRSQVDTIHIDFFLYFKTATSFLCLCDVLMYHNVLAQFMILTNRHEYCDCKLDGVMEFGESHASKE